MLNVTGVRRVGYVWVNGLFLLLIALAPLTWSATLYCPSADDLQMSWMDKTAPVLYNGGWSISGGGGVTLKSAFNVINGWIAYTVDYTNVPTGVNANIFSTSPHFSGSVYDPKVDSCDGNNVNWCVEVDFIETNGNCGGQSTLHTIPGTGPSNNCNGWGCFTDYHYGSTAKATFNMNVSFDSQGHWTTVRDGQTLPALNPVPQESDWNALANALKINGSLIVSTQWVGWVPLDDCGTVGNLDDAKMSISNLQIYGDVVQGPIPTRC